ncbi:hypothetical protein [Chamaesiphon sp. VAR_69_metabat_338]|uniref:hypothetical protein n=1 Tax=Chamaesiphon sp. VAR_69_metabat_338 TaxID=2964704 RepID=UPI00286DBD17|nr:hypothetical protein [Chamaesiphon sp. VAR_69_metabat_338]
MLSNIFTMSIEIASLQLVAPIAVDFVANIHIDLDLSSHGLVVAEQFQSVDILNNIQNGWNDFLSTGKAGVLAIGLVLGYMVRGITS